MGLGTIEVAVPNTEETTDDWDVLLNWSLLEVLVHGMGTGEELVEVVVTNVDGHRETNRRPNRVTSANPALEPKHVLWVDAELLDLLLVRRESHEMLGDCLIVIVGLLQEPLLCRVCIGDGFCGGEGLGGNQEEGCLWVGGTEGFGDVGSIDVAHKVEGKVPVGVWLEGLCDHHRPAVHVSVSKRFRGVVWEFVLENIL